ncbi:hypothetical protein [Herpetosiphon geysericola]|uniref:Uncharacterized protein n=1 Tax=Herpetosiphon geysericola TaxID=70996 RepID=A0A0P6YYS9_9CHLR|nr:hypothetical protein [Herpetosiphon geysericola]KPL90406.1 hypothetical protein SE18_07310 [Herpetosiphon geysericola]
MKLLGRIVIIALAAALVIGGLVALVPSSAAAGFAAGRPERQLTLEAEQSTTDQSTNTARPEFAGRERGGDHHEGGFVHIIRNAAIMAIIIALVAFGMRRLRRRRDLVWL